MSVDLSLAQVEVAFFYDVDRNRSAYPGQCQLRNAITSQSKLEIERELLSRQVKQSVACI